MELIFKGGLWWSMREDRYEGKWRPWARRLVASFAFQAAPSVAVIDLPSDYPWWSAVDGETGKFHGNHSCQRAGRLRQKAVRRQVSLWSSGSKSCVRHLTGDSRLQETDERAAFFVRLSVKLALDAGEKLSERDPENAMANRYQGAEDSKADRMTNLSAEYFQWEETRTSPSWALFVLCKLSWCSFRAPRIGKCFLWTWTYIFRWTVSFIVLCVFHNTLFVLLSFFHFT